MDELRALFQKYVNASFNDLVNVAGPSAGRVLKTLDNLTGSKEKAVQCFMAIISSVVCVDGVVNRKEHELFNAILGGNFTYDQFNNMVKDQNSSQLRNSVDELVDKLSKDEKADFVLVMLCFAACNGELTVEEQKYLVQLLA